MKKTIPSFHPAFPVLPFLTSLFFILHTSYFISLTAQVTFVIDSLPAYTPPEDDIYIAGDFTGWDPGDPAYRMEKNPEEKWFITLSQQPEGTVILFKFTRGDWETVEKGVYGEEIPDRQFTYGNGDTVGIVIFNWRDHGGGGTSTAAENVEVMDENFYIPQLQRTRRIWIYYPPDYDDSEDHYPVLYMHDGQNLFDALTSYAGEWEVDETLNELASQGYQVPIVVGIDNGGVDRISEYTPWPNATYGGGDGKQYVDFLVETLKPYIDQHYRTLPGREFTGIMGSSLGGLISHYGALKYQEIFSKTGIFSPSYWWSDSVWTFTLETGKQDLMKIYQMAGTLEGSNAVANMLLMEDTLKYIGFFDNEIISKAVQGGQHNENLWRQEFGEAYLWLFTSYAFGIDNPDRIVDMEIYPNPAADIIHVSLPAYRTTDSLKILDTGGRCLIETIPEGNGKVDVSALNPGIYIVFWDTKVRVFMGKFVKE